MEKALEFSKGSGKRPRKHSNRSCILNSLRRLCRLYNRSLRNRDSRRSRRKPR